MSITFNADEIFEMAEEIERNGAAFYRSAAEKASDGDVKQFLVDMATMEDGHEVTFTNMRKELSAADKESTSFDPYDEAALYLQSMADAHGTEGKISTTVELSGDESMKDIFNIAINAERNSVCFYVGLKELVPSASGKERVDKIIKEELAHIATLQNKLASL